MGVALGYYLVLVGYGKPILRLWCTRKRASRDILKAMATLG